jgi:leucyl-tRNA synthetase
MVNSSNNIGLDLNGQKVTVAIKLTIEWLVLNERGEASVQYKLRDWLFSRQRYWGEPIPIIHGKNNEIIPLDYSDLPLTLPNVEKYEPVGTG